MYNNKNEKEMFLMHKLMSSDNCYEGMNEKGEGFVGGIEYLKSKDCSDIHFSKREWDEEKAFFEEFLRNSIESFEKRFKANVLEVAICGKVGLWSGTRIGGRIISNCDVFSFGSDIENYNVSIDDDRSIYIEGNHSDGVHSMGIYFITESVLRSTGYLSNYNYERVNAFDYNFFKKIYASKNPLKLSKNNSFFSIEKNTEQVFI